MDFECLAMSTPCCELIFGGTFVSVSATSFYRSLSTAWSIARFLIFDSPNWCWSPVSDVFGVVSTVWSYTLNHRGLTCLGISTWYYVFCLRKLSQCPWSILVLERDHFSSAWALAWLRRLSFNLHSFPMLEVGKFYLLVFLKLSLDSDFLFKVVFTAPLVVS